MSSCNTSNVELLSDRVAATSLGRRLDREKQRQDRIFNTKIRTIGIDKLALDNQVKEKKADAEAKRDSLNAYAAEMGQSDISACLFDSQQAKEWRVLEEATVSYRRHFQQPWSQREDDLNNPEHYIKADRVDAQMMLPGLAGEDPDRTDRLRRQKEQLRQWSIQQQKERAATRQQEKLKDEQYEQDQIKLDNKALQLQKIEEERRKAIAVATKDFNLAKAAETKRKQRMEQERNEEDNRADILNHLQLIRDAELSSCVLGGPLLGPGANTRASQNQQQMTQFHKEQIGEKKRLELERKQEEWQQDRLRLDSARATLLLERRLARINKQIRGDLDSANAKLAEEQKQQKKFLEKEYKSSLDDSFFSKFNTSSR
ncbi:RIB43A-like with coiled-coils protein 2 [Lampris incognitus]|uniref:RIB43A-like with coiled-coils protein 2 n=1 Tax=Lampris incognitus TaxID=2546036 RepID=UPI0024B5A938|nr:RIB43A-like with coiled-coils protein 2 [Lampris incognitus]